MRPRLGIFAGLPILDLFPGGSGNIEAIAYATGTVIVIVAVLLFILALAGKAPILRWGGFRFEATRSREDESARDLDASDPRA